MRAVVVREYGPASIMKVEEVPEIDLQPREVRIKVDSCGVCFHDIKARSGILQRSVEFPFIPGHEVAGEIIEIGREVTQFQVGNLVASVQRRHICGHCRYCRSSRETLCEDHIFLGDAGFNGGYAETVCISEDNLALVPQGMKLEEAAIAACAIGTELNAVRDTAKVKAGEKVLVTGAGGGLGLHGVQLAKLAGGYVIAVTSSEEKADKIREAGAHEVVLAARGQDFSPKVLKVTGGEGVDVVIDNVGAALFAPTLASMALGGRWVLLGQVDTKTMNLRPSDLFGKNLTMLTAKSTSRQQLRDTLELLDRKMVRPIIVDRLPLEGAVAAHQMIEDGNVMGRFVLKPAL